MIRIGQDFSRFPGGRFLSDGPNSGELFRDKHLVPALKESTAPLKVIIDDVAGLPASFLEEAFGGLLRHHGFTEAELKKRLSVVAENPRFRRYPDLIWEYIATAAGALRRAV